jgi:hypothetical protein
MRKILSAYDPPFLQYSLYPTLCIATTRASKQVLRTTKYTRFNIYYGGDYETCPILGRKGINSDGNLRNLRTKCSSKDEDMSTS